jgi:hypothetical protein
MNTRIRARDATLRAGNQGSSTISGLLVLPNLMLLFRDLAWLLAVAFSIVTKFCAVYHTGFAPIARIFTHYDSR